MTDISTESALQAPIRAARIVDSSPLTRLERFVVDAEIILSALTWLRGVGDKLILLAECLDDIVRMDPDAAIAWVHLADNHRPSIAHSTRTGILCAVTAHRMGFDDERRFRVLAAALAGNASIMEMFDKLHSSPSRPSPTRMMDLRQHPTRTASLLRKTGVRDEALIRIVEQHHERPDGSGFPAGLSVDGVSVEALTVGLADRYAEFVMIAGHRRATPPRKCLRDVFKDPAYQGLDELVNAFIKELTIFPPGSLVRLTEGDEAVVVRRGDDSLVPKVAMIDPQVENKPGPHWAVAPSCAIGDSLSARPLAVAYHRLWDQP